MEGDFQDLLEATTWKKHRKGDSLYGRTTVSVVINVFFFLFFRFSILQQLTVESLLLQELVNIAQVKNQSLIPALQRIRTGD